MRKPFADRFWARVTRNDRCWLWTGTFYPNGYGQMRFGGPLVGVHRIAWQLSRGDIPIGLCVLHRCDTPACVNPDHLFLGTRADNMADMAAKGKAARRYGNPSKGATLPPDTVQEIRHFVFREGYSQAAVARKLGLHQTTVNKICTGRSHAS